LATTRQLWTALATSAPLACAGCYLSHTREGEPLAEGTACEPIVFSGERPSDRPEAEDWLEPPVIDGPCCTATMDVDVSSRLGAAIFDWGGVPIAAWTGRTAGLFWYRTRRDDVPAAWFGAVDQSFDAALTPRRFGRHVPKDVAWACGSFAVLGLGVPSELALIAEDGAPGLVTSIEGSELGGAVVRHAAVHAWAAVVVHRPSLDSEPDEARLAVWDDSLALRVERDLGATRWAEGRSVGVVSFADRLVVFHGTEEGVRARTFAGGDVVEGPGDVLSFIEGDFAATRLAAVALRDAVVVVVYGGSSILRSAVFDPFTGRFATGPIDIGRGTGDAPHVVVDERGGTIGHCQPAFDGLWFQLLGPDASSLGEAVHLASATVSTCTVLNVGTDDYRVLWTEYGDRIAGDPFAATLRGVKVVVRREGR
jgi:hypothetical protein